MLVDKAHFDSLSAQSAQRVLVRCDSCGAERQVIKQNLVRAKSHDCLHCMAVRVGLSHRGHKHDAEHRRKTGLASRGRKKTEDGCRRIAAAHTGSKNTRWNPDRDAVRRNELARRAAYTLLYRLVRRAGHKKAACTAVELGYTANDLATHIEAQFQPGMSWANRREWHIDHRKAVSRFIAEGVTDPAVINALSNLQPLWAGDNMSKRDH